MILNNGDIVMANEVRRALRTKLLNARQSMSVDTKAKLDANLCSKLIHLVDTVAPKPTSIAIYWPIRGEPDILPAVYELLDRGYEILLPMVADKHAPLQFGLFTRETVLKRGAYNILEPDVIANEGVRPNIVVIPCVGFNADKYRLGYGGGYYDRTLAAWKEAGASIQTIGIAYADAQVEFEHNEFDVPMDIILTTALDTKSGDLSHVSINK